MEQKNRHLRTKLEENTSDMNKIKKYTLLSNV